MNKVNLGYFLSQKKRRVEVKNDEIYRQIGVKLWGEGAYERDTIKGSDTKYKYFYQVKSGDVIVNKIWARNGSIAVVTDELDGLVGSSEFPTFCIDQGKAELSWVKWLTRSEYLREKCLHLSGGTSGKKRLKPEQFLGIEVNLPTMEKQQEISSFMDKIASFEDHIAQITDQTSKLKESFLRSNYV